MPATRDLRLPWLPAFLLYKGEMDVRVFEIVCLKQPQTAIDLIVTWRLDVLAGEIGLEIIRQENKIIPQLMKHDSYRRISGAIRQVGWS